MELKAAMYRQIARDALRGSWVRAAAAGILAGWLGVFMPSLLGIAVYLLLAVAAVCFLEFIPGACLACVLLAILFALVQFFFGGVVQLGYIDFNLALLDRRRTELSMLFHKGASWWNALCAKLWRIVLVGLGSLCLIVPGILLHYSFAMVPYILEEKPDFTVREAFFASRQIMRGHRWQLFCLRLSFIGWYVPGILTCGIGLIFVLPYRYAAEAAFYNEISGRADLYYGRRRQPVPQEETEWVPLSMSL